MFTQYEMTQYERTLNAIFIKSESKSESTLGRWCDRARAVAGAVDVLKDDLTNKYEKDKGQYSTAKNNERWYKMQEERKIFIDLARSKLESDLDNVLEAKRAAFSKAMGAPDADSLRLLQTLAMREKIGAAEIAATAEHLSRNLQALSVLREIAKRNDVAFPKLNTDFLDTEKKIREEADRTISYILNEDAKSRHTAGLNFLKGEGQYKNGSMHNLVEDIDNPAWLTCDISEIKETVSANGGDENASS